LRVFQLDDEYAKKRKKTWPYAFKIAVYCVGLIWITFSLNFVWPFVDFNRYGIHPRQLNGLLGIFSCLFLHGSLSHIISNTLPLFLAITALFGNYPKIAKRVLFLAIILTGLMVWLFARSANHIGASGLLYSL
jgi:membrane associated rhomboid family serine protease